jgi:hypothetical protein
MWEQMGQSRWWKPRVPSKHSARYHLLKHAPLLYNATHTPAFILYIRASGVCPMGEAGSESRTKDLCKPLPSHTLFFAHLLPGRRASSTK